MNLVRLPCSDGWCRCELCGRQFKDPVNGAVLHSCGETVGAAALVNGPGTELKALLAKIGIHSSPTCKCNQMALRMNLWGPDECLNHIEEIVDVMEEEARKRSLPFLRGLGRLIVKKAIRRARDIRQ